jgi:hypothetical protein
MTRLKAALIPLLAAVTAVLSGCGANDSRDVFAVKRGMTKQQVRATAGAPDRVGRRCWLYRAKKHGTSIDGLRVCFSDGRVSLKQISMHG